MSTPEDKVDTQAQIDAWIAKRENHVWEYLIALAMVVGLIVLGLFANSGLGWLGIAILIVVIIAVNAWLKFAPESSKGADDDGSMPAWLPTWLALRYQVPAIAAQDSPHTRKPNVFLLGSITIDKQGMRWQGTRVAERRGIDLGNLRWTNIASAEVRADRGSRRTAYLVVQRRSGDPFVFVLRRPKPVREALAQFKR